MNILFFLSKFCHFLLVSSAVKVTEKFCETLYPRLLYVNYSQKIIIYETNGRFLIF